VLLAMPLMFSPGTIATVLGMASLVRHPKETFSSCTIGVEMSSGRMADEMF